MRSRELVQAKSELDRMVSENPGEITGRIISDLTSKLSNGYHRIDLTFSQRSPYPEIFDLGYG